MVFPDYKNSIVNVAASVMSAFGAESLYTPLKELEFIGQYEKIALLLIDGLGYDFLQKYGKDSFLGSRCLGKITSVFPSTTASAAIALET